ncbi:MAG: beta-ketoacyl synthase N-terminal-like domain-containing protein [Planctomycetota bacterium]
MSLTATVLACGVVDEHGISGTRGVTATWQELETAPPGTGRTLKAVFGKSDATFRRIDLPARALVLACEAAGLDQVLTEPQRNEAAICVETDVGSLTTDVDFQLSLEDEVVHAGIFPYSLTSTSLGEVALRYKLRGPTISMSVLESAPGESLREALRMLAAEDVPFVVAGVADALREPAAGRDACVRAVVAVLALPQNANGNGIATLDWPAEDDPTPFAQLHRLCR